jgi:putative nucleotidyltransferase with HDIG domain
MSQWESGPGAVAEYNPLAVDAYAGHLAEVNRRREVAATEDIYNSDGLLLVKKGTPITPDITRRIINFKLQRSLESSVSIANEIDGNRLHKEFASLLRQDQALYNLSHRQGLDLVLQSQCNRVQQYPFLRQKLTVLVERMPELYQRSLHAALLCLMMARQMRLPDEDVDAVFLAALVHDIGMLHINPELVFRQGSLTPEEWRQIQAHVVIGQKILEAAPGVPSAVSRAVLEHHERCDGTGYPAQLQGKELGQLGQMINLADSVVAVYENRLKPRGDQWRDMIPMLQMSGHSYFYRNYAALITLLRNSDEVTPTSGSVSLTQLVDKLVEQITLFQSCFHLLHEPLKSLHSSSERNSRALINVYAHVTLAVRGSGVLEESYCSWLKHVRAQRLTEVMAELRELHLMLEELAFHLHRLCRMVGVYPTADNLVMSQLKAQLEPMLNQLARLIDVGGEAHKRAAPEKA